MALSACQFTEAGLDVAVGQIAVGAPDPLSASVGREVLADGGTAADAAAAMALALTATLPSRVGIAGGGVCLVHDPETDTVRMLDFMPRDTGTGAAAPGFLRGIFALQSEYGALRWEQVAARAETLARFGHPVTGALAADIRAALDGAGPGLDAGAAALFAPGGAPLPVGADLVQLDLADMLGAIRVPAGIGSFYGGNLGSRYADAAGAAGWPLAADGLSAVRPAWLEALGIELGNDRLYVTADAAGQRLSGDWPAAGSAAATPGASVVALSGEGGAVACNFTINGLFGSGAMAAGTGMFVAPPPAGGQLAHAGVGIAVNHPLDTVIFLGAGSGSTAALASPMAAMLVDGRSAQQALEAPRSGIAGRGMAIYCDWDRSMGLQTRICQAAADPPGFAVFSRGSV